MKMQYVDYFLIPYLGKPLLGISSYPTATKNTFYEEVWRKKNNCIST
jgi:hypothetical protein